MGIQATADNLVFFIRRGDLECCLLRSAGRGGKLKNTKRARISTARLLSNDGIQQLLKRGLQVRLIMHKQHILTEQRRMMRPRLEAAGIAIEKQPAANHIHGAYDHGRPSRVE